MSGAKDYEDATRRNGVDHGCNAALGLLGENGQRVLRLYGYLRRMEANG